MYCLKVFLEIECYFAETLLAHTLHLVCEKENITAMMYVLIVYLFYISECIKECPTKTNMCDIINLNANMKSKE
jgi:hypothetical protein